MAIVNKNFKVKNGLNVAGPATFDAAVNVDNLVLNSTPPCLRFINWKIKDPD